MAYNVRILLTSAAAKIERTPQSTDKQGWIQSCIDYLQALQVGAKYASLDTSVATVAATGTLTFTGAPTNGQTCVINGVTFTAVTSGATGNQFNIGGTVTISATNLAAAVNASATLLIPGCVTASSLAGVVTFTAFMPGRIGNSVTLTTAMTNTSVSGARLTGGTDPTEVLYHFGA